jgi:hypothetical protein
VRRARDICDVRQRFEFEFSSRVRPAARACE